VSVATAQVNDLIKDGYSTVVQGAQEYNRKLLECAVANSSAAFEFAQTLLRVKSPSEFAELSTETARKQMATLTEQTKELAAIAQKVAQKAGFTKAFRQDS
jgi:hypothetical protein